MNFLIPALKLAPYAIQAGGAIFDFIRGRKQRKQEEKQREQRVKEARAEFDNRIRQLDNQKHQYERLNEDYRNKIYDLEQQIRMNNEETFVELHNKIDELLLNKFEIPIDEFDKNYVPHITLFRDDEKTIDVVYERLKDKLILNNISIDKYALGTSLENNEFYKGEK